jgi:hypothetical protein
MVTSMVEQLYFSNLKYLISLIVSKIEISSLEIVTSNIYNIVLGAK